ncbi:hypothetical protein GCM10009582_32550 [Arthrobacter flavus]
MSVEFSQVPLTCRNRSSCTLASVPVAAVVVAANAMGFPNWYEWNQSEAHPMLRARVGLCAQNCSFLAAAAGPQRPGSHHDTVKADSPLRSL